MIYPVKHKLLLEYDYPEAAIQFIETKNKLKCWECDKKVRRFAVIWFGHKGFSKASGGRYCSGKCLKEHFKRWKKLEVKNEF